MTSVGRNAACPCGSGKKYKNCCIGNLPPQTPLSSNSRERQVLQHQQIPRLLAQAMNLHQNGQHIQAQALYEQILQIQPRHFDALHFMGILAYQTQNSERSVELIDKAIQINPQVADAYNNRGVALRDIKQYQAAIESYNKAIDLKPDDPSAYYNRGNALQDLKQYQAAIESYDKVIALTPGNADAYNNRGVVLRALRRYELAIESYNMAIALNCGYAEAYGNRGNALADLKQYHAAMESFDQAIVLKPDYAEAYNSRGNVLRAIKQYRVAIENFDKAIALKPDYADAYNNRGAVLEDLKQYHAAIESYDKAIALKPDYEFLYGKHLHARMHVCDWSGIENLFIQLEEKIKRGEKASHPFPVLAITSSLYLQKRSAKIYVEDKHPANYALPEIHKRPRHKKIRIGYFSADFRNHAVSLLTVGLFEKHDRSRFELIAFSFGPDTGDDVRVRIMAAFDQFIDVQNQSDQDIAMLARSMLIDIAVDLGGLTHDSRTEIFAMRAAPVQVSYLGYLGTMGAEYIDYLIADNTIVPEESRQYYSEKIVYLPSYQANDSKRVISSKQFTRDELGLPQTGFVFCCFNNNYKIIPETFDGWMRILKRVEGSVLLLNHDNEQAVINLKKEATRRGVADDRLIFVKRLPVHEYLARSRVADLFLDTLPYNAGTTASDALWVGLPVLTCVGEAFASRVAASLLNAIHLSELITTNQSAYENLAVELATNHERLKKIRERLAYNRLVAPLFDTQLFARYIEAAYMAMYERYQADLPPTLIEVTA